jgi:hypothetical protein
MKQRGNGPSIHANQNDQQGAHKSKNQREFATEALRNELSGKVQKHANPEAGQSFNGKDIQHPANGAPAIRHVVSISPRACATSFRESLADKWLSIGRFKVCFGTALSVSRLSAHVARGGQHSFSDIVCPMPFSKSRTK